MSTKVVSGQVITETAGPIWHLIGSVEGDKAHPNQLVLTRMTDNLSPNIRAMNGQVLVSLTVTDSNGNAFNLSNAQVHYPALPTPKQTPKSGTSSQKNLHELERVSFTFQKITVKSVGGKKSTWDDWISH